MSVQTSTPTSFRLDANALTNIDMIADYIATEHGLRPNRSDAVRVAVNLMVQQLRRKKLIREKPSENSR